MQMVNVEAINFLRDDVGEWFLPAFFGVMFALGSLTKVTLKSFRDGGWRDVLKRCAFGCLIGVLLAAPISLGVAIWHRLGQQYFIKLQLENDRIVLFNRWPQPAVTIPFDDILSVSLLYERHGIRLGGCNRVYVGTAGETFISYGFKDFNEEESAIYKKLTNAVSSNEIIRRQKD
jgi:hypothetical protein